MKLEAEAGGLGQEKDKEQRLPKQLRQEAEAAGLGKEKISNEEAEAPPTKKNGQGGGVRSRRLKVKKRRPTNTKELKVEHLTGENHPIAGCHWHLQFSFGREGCVISFKSFLVLLTIFHVVTMWSRLSLLLLLRMPCFLCGFLLSWCY